MSDNDFIQPSPHAGQFQSSIGIRFDRLRAEARACLLVAKDVLETPPEILAIESEPLPFELLHGLRDVEQSATDQSTRESLRTDLTAIATRLSQRLLASSNFSKEPSIADSLLAIGIHGDGIWHVEGKQAYAYRSMVNATRIAEQFGKTVVSGFPERDFAQGGRGGPVESHGIWLLLADRANRLDSTYRGCHWRGLVDVSRHATQFSIVGPIEQHLKTQPSPANDVCVGDQLLAELVASFSSDSELTNSTPGSSSDSLAASSSGSAPVDVGKVAAQGTPILELLEIWQATMSRDSSWNPHGMSALPLIYAWRNSIYATSPLKDLLATAIHLIALEIGSYVRHRIPAATPIGELFFMGEGTTVDLIVHVLVDQLPGVAIRRLSELGQDRTLYASAVAALVLLNLWQVPLPSTKPGEVPRVLGRVTPGNPSNWRHVLRVMNSNAPWLLPLREAI